MTARENRPAVTESPWYWVLMFSVAGTLALLAALPKYGRRQEQIENEYLAHRYRAETVQQTDATDAAGVPSDAPHERAGFVPMYPLLLATAALAAWSAWMLYREQRGRPREDNNL